MKISCSFATLIEKKENESSTISYTCEEARRKVIKLGPPLAPKSTSILPTNHLLMYMRTDRERKD
jgi:hypothetical protein